MIGDLAGRAIGLSTGGDAGLQKLRISYRERGSVQRAVEALFNPAEISRNRTVRWEQRPMTVAQGQALAKRNAAQQFLSIEAETLSVTLLFDTYGQLPTMGGSKRVASFLQQASPVPLFKGVPVTKHTDQVVRLGKVDPHLHHPPVCTLSWGRYRNFFVGVLTQLDQQLTLFLPDGTPVRATLGCTFQEISAEVTAGGVEPESSDVVKSRVLRRGETLHSLAAQEYGDPARWRHIALANGITNPRTVRPGTSLTIPKLAE